MTVEEVAADIRGQVRELNDTIAAAAEEHNVTTKVVTDGNTVEVKLWLRKTL